MTRNDTDTQIKRMTEREGEGEIRRYKKRNFK